MKLRSALCAVTALVSVGATAAMAEELTIATVNNSDMIIMQKLSPQWEEATGHTLNWVVLEENVLRQRVTTDIATSRDPSMAKTMVSASGRNILPSVCSSVKTRPPAKAASISSNIVR